MELSKFKFDYETATRAAKSEFGKDCIIHKTYTDNVYNCQWKGCEFYITDEKGVIENNYKTEDLLESISINLCVQRILTTDKICGIVYSGKTFVDQFDLIDPEKEYTWIKYCFYIIKDGVIK